MQLCHQDWVTVGSLTPKLRGLPAIIQGVLKFMRVRATFQEGSGILESGSRDPEVWRRPAAAQHRSLLFTTLSLGGSR